MRSITFALAVLGVAITADAQQRERERRDPPAARASQPPPAVTAPRPPYVVPRPVPPQGMRQSPYPPHARAPFRPQYGYPIYGAYPYSFTPFAERTLTMPAAMVTTGVVQFDITPSTALDYYVDGIFMGTSSQLGNQVETTAGGRRLEVRRAGYKPIAFDVRIAEGSITMFRGTLEPIAEVPGVPPPAIGGRTLYVIPGCYFGNIRPQQADLRQGCDLAAMKVRTPPQ